MSGVQGVPFTMVPQWLTDVATPRAVFMYVVLGRFVSNTTSEAWPSVATLAEVAGCSVTVAREALRELESVGAIDIVERFDAKEGPRTNLYVMKSNDPRETPSETPSGGDSGIPEYPPENPTVTPPRNPRVTPPRDSTVKLDSLELDPVELETPPTPPSQRTLQVVTPTGVFDQFWTVAVRKTGKGAARIAYHKATELVPVEVLTQAWITANNAWATWADPTKIPHPATWLNQERWDDDPPSPANIQDVDTIQRATNAMRGVKVL